MRDRGVVLSYKRGERSGVWDGRDSNESVTPLTSAIILFLSSAAYPCASAKDPTWASTLSPYHTSSSLAPWGREGRGGCNAGMPVAADQLPLNTHDTL